MLVGDEVVCAIADARADAGVAEAAAALAAALGLPLVLVGGPAQPPDALRRLAEELPGAVTERSYQDPYGAVLRGLGRALGTALLVIPDHSGEVRQLLDASGCPLVLVPRDEATQVSRAGGVVRCVVGDAGGGARTSARVAAALEAVLDGELLRIPARERGVASTLVDVSSEVVVLVRQPAPG